ncbi:hypothetical protein FKN01_22235 [Streptomyces sp. 130]|uniref:hypothetical protein n=1 Tax=Streptomyces sp. 130 TaxID=2591006 RepID=UPI001181052B|nr:hypothetical protein [Streptomyces sp. 130]TRV75148.1 hypothetical protein FKN01_22235 [Streptomyces sp. 130]
MKRTTNLLAAATRPAVPALDLTKHGKCPFTVDAVQQTAAAADALPTPRYTGAQLDGHECARCGVDLAYAQGERPYFTPDGERLNVCYPPCDVRCAYEWCTVTGDHTTHTSAYIEAPTVDGYGDHLLPASIMAEDGPNGFKPFVGFLDLDLTPEQVRTRCADLRTHLEKVEALADQLDGRAPLEPAAECYSVTTSGAAGDLLSAEIFRSDDVDNLRTSIAVWSQPRSGDELDVAGADQLIADLEQFIPRLRALRNHLATVEDSQ